MQGVRKNEQSYNTQINKYFGSLKQKQHAITDECSENKKEILKIQNVTEIKISERLEH